MSLTFENLPRDYEQLPVPVYILKGRSSSHQNGLLAALSDKFPPQYYEVVDGYFKAYLHLGPGSNTINLKHIEGGWDQNGYAAPKQGGKTYGEAAVTITYEPLNKHGEFQVPKIHLCVLVGKDSNGNFDCPKQSMYQGNGLDTAVRKLRVAGRLMQAFTLDEMSKNGVGKRCFQFVEEDVPSTISRQDLANHATRSQIKIHVIRSKHTVAELRDMNYAQQNGKAKEAGKLFDFALEALKDSGGDFSDSATNQIPALAAVLILDAHWSKKQNTILAHAALGGGTDRIKLAIFGSHGLHSWPMDWESIYRGYTDCSRLSTDEVANDCNECSSRWECLCVTLGAFMHEIGHSLGCPHQENGVMLRDYVTMDRKFLSKERYSIRTKRSEWSPVLTKDEPGWNRLDIIRFLYHPAFTLAQDFNDPSFKPPVVLANQGMKLPDGVDKGPNFIVINQDTLDVQSETGIYLVECHVGEWSRLHYEYIPTFYNGMGPQRSVRLNYSIMQQQLSPEWRGKPIKLEVLTMGFGQNSVDDLQGYLASHSQGIQLEGGRIGRKSDTFGLNGGRPVQALFPPGKQVAQIRVTHGMALDGFDIIFDDRFCARFGNAKSHYSDFYLGKGEQLIGIAVHSGAWVDGIQFITNKQTSPLYGGSGGSLHKFMVPSGTSILGFYGNMGDWCNKIGVIYG
ncbi:DEKNAAC104731 [Brettanomyces naardenensis]|uniref:DEKNAAC104731 n=1 Tax=Brettanomyces naardenensis TaxID=13370 RepID=A0A448YR26_BRENA|nr:DEKNAAC104731 [Brettanomyces naardenensis]